MRRTNLKTWLISMAVILFGFGSAVADFVILADSSSEFSGTQGQDNWYYGYYDGDGPAPYTNADFELLPRFDGWQWYIPGLWTALWDEGGHPEDNGPHWVVRRWVSEVTGAINITGILAKINDLGGDGIRGYILVDGQEVWSQYIAYNDRIGVNYTIDVNVNIGSLVDFAITPAGRDTCDGSAFTVIIYFYLVPRPAITHYVDVDAPPGGDGSSWTKALKRLQDALAFALPNDEIRVAQGTYKPDRGEGIMPADRTATFQLKNGVAIKGGYAGFGEPDPNERDPNIYETILSGDLLGNDGPDFANNGENSYHVVASNWNNETAVLNGFTITAGNANLSYWRNRCGGGMFNYPSAKPTLTNCTFSGNSAGNGGGMSNFGESNPTLTNCTFSGNSADYGGGMYNWSSSPTLVNCIFSGSSATESGGGIFNDWECSPTLTNCTFAGNSALSGNALGCDSYNQWYPSSIQVTNCILRDGGDEIWNNDNSVITITYSDVQGGWTGTGNINADPCFVELGYWDPNGVWIEGDYHLLAGSPCINAGDPDYIAEPNEKDLDGKSRVIGDRIDMGAYEFNHIPVADAGPNRIVEAQGSWGATVTLDASGSSDADSTPGTNDDINDFDWYKVDNSDPNIEDFLGSGEIIDCNLSFGEHIIILEVIDRAGAFNVDDVTIVVQDTTPPVIICPADVTLECPADTSVEANGSATAGDTCGAVTITHSEQWQPACGNTGALTRTWTATDECGNSSSCAQTITVVDTTQPEFAFSVTPTVLWPANHKMVLITPTWTASDKCDASPDILLVSIVMNEGDNIIGDGHTTNDIRVDDDGSIYLRAERSGTGSDRIYSITYQAVDDCGNAAVRSATVTVPHDQR